MSKKALFAFVFYLVMPIIAISIILTGYPELDKKRFILILQRIIPIGVILITVSQLSIRYQKGTVKRFLLNEVYVLLVLLWLFALLGGQPVIHQTWAEYHFKLNIWNYLLLILFITSMNVLYYLVEFHVYRTSSEPSCEPKGGQEGEEEYTLEKDRVAHGPVIVTTVDQDAHL